MPGRIVQFGTSRFLQPHVDLFVHEARAEGQDVGPISVVKTTSDTIRNDRIYSEEVVQGFAACGTHVSGEPWRVLAVSALDGDRFLVSVRYAAGDIRTYRLPITEPGERDEFLKAEQAVKKGKIMVGRAQRSRAGLAGDGDMRFQFSDAPQADPKNTGAAADSNNQTAER